LEGNVVPEIRASITVELHRRLKGEAVRKGMHLKQLIAQILEEHAGGRSNKNKTPKPSTGGK